MNDLLKLLGRLSLARRLILGGATLGVFIGILALSRLGADAENSLLYAGLDSHAAGQVIAALDQAATPYEVRGDAIYVPAVVRDSLRMQLAAQGLPSTGGQGYELLDGLSGFGTTSQMFDAAYWRAKEGELARTVLAMPNVRMARVHIAAQNSNAFLRSSKLSASITVTMSTGSVTREQAEALRHLLASAVGQMTPADVTVIDSVAGIVSPAGEASGQQDPLGKAEALKHNLERLLEARVGPGRAVVEVSLEFVRDREAITERVFDPQGRVTISSENESRSENSTQPAGDITVASNLPDGDAASTGQGTSQSTSSRERVNFDVSQTQREIVKEPGSIKRMTIAVLVDGTVATAADGATTWQPRTDQELSDLRELVSAAAGVDESRGDVLTLKSLEFQTIAPLGSAAEAGLLSMVGPINLMSLAQLAFLALVVLGLGLFVMRPLLLQARRQPADLGNPRTALPLPPPNSTAPTSALTGEIADDDVVSGMSVVTFDRSREGAVDQADPVARLKRLIDARQAESVEILRGWLEQQEDGV